MQSAFCGGFFSTQRSQRISQRCAEKRLPLRNPLHCCSSESSRAARIFFLSPRRRRGERTEERGDSQQSNQARPPSPAPPSLPMGGGGAFWFGLAPPRPFSFIFSPPFLMPVDPAPFPPSPSQEFLSVSPSRY